MIDSTAIEARIHQIQSNLPDSVRLIAVTKYVTIAEMRAAYACGIRDFAESRVQDAQQKIAELDDFVDVTWHFIGHLQRNKAKSAIQLFDWIHSVDSLKLAQRLNQLATELNRDPQILLQVKMRPDPQKKGWHPESLMEHIGEIGSLEALNIRGLMTILPQGLNEQERKETFLATHTLLDTINAKALEALHLEHLSMGMSQDYPQAIEAGATMIRLGSVLFPKHTFQ